MAKLIDITRPISAATLLHPGDPAPMFTRYCELGKGKDYNLTLATFGLHTGTHFDFPRHFRARGKTVEDFPAETFACPAHVVDCEEADAVELAHLADLDLRPGDAVLFKTRNGRAAQDQLQPGWVYITPEVARVAVDAGCAIVGADYIEVEQGTDAGHYPVHETLLGNDVLLLENIDLRRVEAGQYKLYCFPILIPGMEAAPCRAVLEVADHR